MAAATASRHARTASSASTRPRASRRSARSATTGCRAVDSLPARRQGRQPSDAGVGGAARRMMPPAEHLASSPEWQWWILGYFFFGGIAGGSYALGTLLRFAGDPRDERAARIAFIASFIALI